MAIGFLKRARSLGASTSTKSLLRYIRSIKGLENTSTFIYPKEEILTSLEYCYFIKYLRKFYRVGGGEIN
jgi:hypothetical protein